MDRRSVVWAGLATAAALSTWSLRSIARDDSPIRELPQRFQPQPFNDLEGAIDPSLTSLVIERIQLQPEMGFAAHLHWLRTFANPDASNYRREASREVLSILTDAREIEERFGQFGIIVQSRDGVRYATRRSGLKLKPRSAPAHRYQELAVFGEIGVPSSAPIQLHNHTAVLKDVILDCLANLQLRDSMRQEPEWPTQAILHYLKPSQAWTNRWGEHITINDWVDFLLQRDIIRFSCGGTHMIHSIALLLQAHQQQQTLSPSVFDRVCDACREFCSMLESTQHDDGSWSNDWHLNAELPGYTSTEKMGVHLTGHILEAAMYLPQELRIADTCAGAALQYLSRAFRTCTDQNVLENYCIYSHAGNVLLACSPEESA